MISIRAATLDDVSLLMSLTRGLAEYERMEDQLVATEDDIANALFGPNPWAEAILASLDGRTAGFAVFFTNYSTFRGRPGIYLEDLFVLPELRGKGLGRALLARLAQIAVERKCARLEWAVLDWNEPAIGFYKGLGAVPMDEWTVYRLTGEPLDRLASESR